VGGGGRGPQRMYSDVRQSEHSAGARSIVCALEPTLLGNAVDVTPAHNISCSNGGRSVTQGRTGI